MWNDRERHQLATVGTRLSMAAEVQRRAGRLRSAACMAVCAKQGVSETV